MSQGWEGTRTFVVFAGCVFIESSSAIMLHLQTGLGLLARRPQALCKTASNILQILPY